ncbi:MAG: MBOAT family protein [Gammaproteobacteria bacterium]|nr:MAG: MBOAT family protein [Gammaproteobacteria bacterium]
MLFNSYTFVVFFGVVLLFHNLPFSWRTKKYNLLWASYLFYAAWNPPFVVLLWISTITDWIVAKRIFLSNSPMTRRFWLLISLGVNLGFLVFFKYSGFLLENLVGLLDMIGIVYSPPELDIILPVGISFYTFQSLSYTLDIYKGRLKPWNSLLDFSLFVTFFPQLVAGPIVRAADFLPQCKHWMRTTTSQLGWGLSLMLLGIFQKSVVADGLLAAYVEQIYDTGAIPNTLAAWAGTLAFTGQIFCDFAGYSTTAIGAAMCLGFKLPDNFRFPYAAIGFSDFWQRWHISLSTWLRDYLYIPLGGNRQGFTRTKINLMLTMLIGGLWHGASWNFVVWGGLHGTYLIVEQMLVRRMPALPLWKQPQMQFLFGLLTFALICITWVFFRANDLGRSIEIVGAILAIRQGSLYLPFNDVIVIFSTVSSILLCHWLLRDTTLEEAASKTPWWLKSLIISSLAAAIIMMPGEDRAFIYFQF